MTETGLLDGQPGTQVQEAAIRRLQARAGDRAQWRADPGRHQVRVWPHADRRASSLIDEVHTPDCSRFWVADTYAARLAAGEEPENFDKEFVRLWYADHGYRGDGEPFPLPDELAVQAAQRYIRTFEALTGRTFEPGALPAQARMEESLRAWGA